MAQARTSSDFHQVVADGADVYLYTTSSPCAGTSPDSAGTSLDCAGEIRKLTRDFDIKRTLMVYDTDYDVDEADMWQDSSVIVKKGRLDSNFDLVKTGN